VCVDGSAKAYFGQSSAGLVRRLRSSQRVSGAAASKLESLGIILKDGNIPGPAPERDSMSLNTETRETELERRVALAPLSRVFEHESGDTVRRARQASGPAGRVRAPVQTSGSASSKRLLPEWSLHFHPRTRAERPTAYVRRRGRTTRRQRRSEHCSASRYPETGLAERLRSLLARVGRLWAVALRCPTFRGLDSHLPR